MKFIKNWSIFLVLCCFMGSFPIKCSGTDYYKGIDVSVYQGSIDFEEVTADGYHQVYIRAGEGDSGEDSLFFDHYQGAKAAGLDIGFYYYVTATDAQEAERQAEEFASLISDCTYQLRPAMDYEEFSSVTVAESNEIALAFLKKLEDSLKQKPVLYSDASNVKTRWDTTLSDFPLWVADYAHLAEPEGYQLPENQVWTQWSGYQYSDNVTVSGISSGVDGDIFTSNIRLSDSEITPETSNVYYSYTVKKRDTLWSLSRYFHVSMEKIVDKNNISNKNLIYAGESLDILMKEEYSVKEGDTLSQLAVIFETTVEKLAKINDISNENLILVGETLKIPL